MGKHWLHQRNFLKARNWEDPTAGKNSKQANFQKDPRQAFEEITRGMSPEKADKIKKYIGIGG